MEKNRIRNTIIRKYRANDLSDDLVEMKEAQVIFNSSQNWIGLLRFYLGIGFSIILSIRVLLAFLFVS